MVILWYYNGIIIGGKAEEMRRKSVVKRDFQTQRRKAAEFSFYEHEMRERNDLL